MTDVRKVISQLEQQKASIHRAIAALREITTLSPAPRPAPAKRGNAQKSSKAPETEPADNGSPLKGRSMTDDQKQAISNAWTPERKQKFAEFHVRRMARAKGENPAKALRNYRRRKQKEQADAAPAAKTLRKAASKKAPRRKSAVKKSPVTKAANPEAATG